MNEAQSCRTVSVLSIVTGVGIWLFWIGFYTVGLAPAHPPACYLPFEHSFTLPDSVLATTLLIGGILTLRRKALGRRFLAAGGAALAFLGLLDVSFNLQNGMYRISFQDGLFNGILNAWCIAFGAVLAVKAGHYRT